LQEQLDQTRSASEAMCTKAAQELQCAEKMASQLKGEEAALDQETRMVRKQEDAI